MEFWYMFYHEPPKKLWGNIVVRMYNAVACADDSFCIGEDNCRVIFQQLIDSLTHYLHIAFDSTLTKNIHLEISKNLLSLEKRLNLLTSIQNVQKIFLAILVHRFALWYDQHGHEKQGYG